MNTLTNRALWWSLVVSLVIYVLVAHVASVRPEREASIALPLAAALGAISIGTAIGTLAYRRRALVAPIRQGVLDLDDPEDQAKAFGPFIANLVLSESIGVYGLVLALLSGRPAFSIPFALAALALMYVHRPTAPDLTPPASGELPAKRPKPIA